MRLSPTHVGLLLAGMVSMNAIAQEGSADSGSAAEYEVIEAPALTSNKIKESVLIEVANAGKRLVAVGAHGNIIVSASADGNTWEQASVPTSVLLTSVDFSDAKHGWATGHHGVIIRTTDGGNNWQRVLDGFRLMELEIDFYQQKVEQLQQRVAQADPAQVSDLEWELDTAKFQLETVQQAQQDSGPTKPFLDIVALDENTALAIGAYGTLVKTADGGQSWTILNNRLDNPNSFHLNAISQDGQRLFIAGEAGTAYSSSDLGETWQAVPPPYSGSFFGAHFDNRGRLWIYGLRGNIFYTDDLGASYTAIDSDADSNLSAGYTDAKGHQWLVGNSGAIIEIDTDLNATAYSHPSNSVITDIIQSGDEKILTGRSGLMFWPAHMSKKVAETTAQGAQ